jgi:hypothetical protein
MATGEPKSELQPNPGLAGLLYRLTVVFPSWAGAIVMLYALFYGLAALRVRFR